MATKKVITECKKKRLTIKLPHVTLTARMNKNYDLRTGDHIQIQLGLIKIICMITEDQQKLGADKFSTKAIEVETLGDNVVKGVFKI